MDEYGGNWITTFTGKKFHFLDPRIDEIDIIDIAHHLSLNCRFIGACKEFYSVAEHSIRVAEIVPYEYRLHALLHDAGEAYIPDLPRPEKANLPEFKGMEIIILQAIFRKFLYPVDAQKPDSELIKEADNILLATEARDLMHNTKDWATLPPPLKDRVIPMKSKRAEGLFLYYFGEYSR